MKISIEKKKDKNGKERRFFLYEGEDGTKVSGADYFVFDVTTETFKTAMNGIGGHTANMTTRFFQQRKIEPTHMALVSIPRVYADYRLMYLYLKQNEDGEFSVLDAIQGESTLDYIHFRKEFASCMVEEGFSFDLSGRKGFKIASKMMRDAGDDFFDIVVSGKHIEPGDTIEIRDFSIFNEEYKKELLSMNVEKGTLSFKGFNLNEMCFKARFFLPDGSPLMRWHIKGGTFDKDEFLKSETEKYGEKGAAEAWEAWGHKEESLEIPLDTVRNIAKSSPDIFSLKLEDNEPSDEMDKEL